METTHIKLIKGQLEDNGMTRPRPCGNLIYVRVIIYYDDEYLFSKEFPGTLRRRVERFLRILVTTRPNL